MYESGEFSEAETAVPGGESQIKDDDSSEDIKHVDLTQVHYLSGPIRVLDSEGLPGQQRLPCQHDMAMHTWR